VRSEIQALRGVAVAFVVIAHLWPFALPGGYVGVDVFFVISGFLITSHLVRELDRDRRVALAKFWARRARRILPAALTVLLACALATIAFVPETRWPQFLGEIRASAAYVENWRLAADAVDYFASENGPSPVQHYWSLSVEEQFYLLWPIVLVVVLAMTTTARQRIRFAIIVAATSAILMAVLFSPGEDATRVYYGTDTHLFGLLVGVALAFTWAAPRSWLHAPGWLRWRLPAGVVALVGLGWLMTVLGAESSATFRGGILAASVLTAVVLASLLGPGSVLVRTMQLWPLEWLGQRSYGIYLWHWPVILILTEALPATTYDSALRWATRGAALLLTLVVAAASYRWLEQPVRERGFVGAWRHWVDSMRGVRPWLPLAAAGAVLLLVATTAVAVSTAPSSSSTQQQLEANEQLVAAAEAEAPVVPPADVSWDEPVGAEITGFGDSIMVTSAHGLTFRWPEIVLDAKSNRQWPDALVAVERAVAADTVRRAVVLDFGTNAGVGEPDVVRATLDALGPGRMVVVVNLYGGSHWIPEANATLEEIVADYPNAIIADWYSAIDADPGQLQSDGIHPDIDGGHLYTDVVAGAFAELSKKLGGELLPADEPSGDATEG
jgi:peptidoglycan/LPS O-acetylase OafA/YrhL